MAPRKYAENTSVPVMRSQVEINKLLYDWGAEGAQWTDHWNADPPLISLRFLWKFGDKKLAARFDLKCDVEEISKRSTTDLQFEKNTEQWKRVAHRLLLVWLKASFNAVDAGMIRAEQIFMPFIEDASGQILGDVFADSLPQLDLVGAMKLITVKAGGRKK